MKNDQQPTEISAYTGHARAVFDELYGPLRDGDLTDLFILKGKKPIACPDFKQWAAWLLTHEAGRLVATTTIGRFRVVTVFTGDSRGWTKQCPRLVFETEVFEADSREPWVQEFPYRYSTWAQAARGHARAVAIAQRNHAPKPRRRKPAGALQSTQDKSAGGDRQSLRRKLTLLCREYGLSVHHHRGRTFFWRRNFTAGSIKEAIAYADGYGQGYFEGMSDETEPT